MQVQGGINMLTSIFKRVSAFAMAGTILTGTMAVPASAKVSVPVPHTSTILSDNFDSYTVCQDSLTRAVKTFAQNSDIIYKRYSPENWGSSYIDIENDTKDGNILSAWYTHGLRINYNNPNGSTAVQPGDSVTVSFRFQYNIASARINVNLNDANTRFDMISSTDQTGDVANANWADTKYGRILTINPTYSRIAVSDNWDRGRINLKTDTWYDVSVTINTRDAEYDDRQTLTAKSGSWKMVGYFDANYTGDGDTTYDLLSSVDSLQFDTTDAMYGTGGDTKLKIDDILIQKTGNSTEYQSDFGTTLINEDFSNLTGSWSYSNDWHNNTDRKASLAGTTAK